MDVRRGFVWGVEVLLLCSLTLANAQTNEIVLHNFGNSPKGESPVGTLIRDATGNLYGTTSGGGPNAAGTIYRLDALGNETVLFGFTGGPDGGNPVGGVIGDGAGNLYGTTASGGNSNAGVVYKLDRSGRETVLHSFTGGADGRYPMASLVRDAAGNLYGTTESGGAGSPRAGVVFKLDPAGNYTVLHSFSGPDGADPDPGVTIDAAGNLYGAAVSGGAAGRGVIYKLDANGLYTLLYSFTGKLDGGLPSTNLLRDQAGNLYGATHVGGYSNGGVVFKVDPTGRESILHDFIHRAMDGCGPSGNLTWDSSGSLYGTTTNCGPFGYGTVYKIDHSGNETLLHSFSGDADGNGPSGVILDAAGNVYGTASAQGPGGAGVLFRIDPSGSLSFLISFQSPADGGFPTDGLIGDGLGNLYGTTRFGGPKNAGVAYKWNATAGESVLHTFTGNADGSSPVGGLIRDAAGNLYGSTSFGGSDGVGVVYKLDPSGVQTVLHTFSGGSDGESPAGTLVGDAAGNLYGIVSGGGGGGVGGVFRIDPSGNETVLHSFTSKDTWPSGGLTRDAAGRLYGSASGSVGPGVVFRLDASGNETILDSFTKPLDGVHPVGNVALDSAGNVYGATNAGGTAGAGVVFRVDTSGHEAILHNFTGGIDGGSPAGGVILDSSGNLFGTTTKGGSSNQGVVYKVDPFGREIVLHSFTGGADGGTPNGTLIRDASGNIYGTTSYGGRNYGGVIFVLTN